MTAAAPQRPALVVLTPVRNEAWILERFLSVTSQFADLIVLADQGSTDNTTAIATRFPKVVVIPNEDPGFDEAHRQDLLLTAARERVPLPRILLALDADEILAADAMDLTTALRSMSLALLRCRPRSSTSTSGASR